MMADGTYGEGRTDASAQHRALVALLTEGGYLSDPRVEAAFRAVPRHLFLPDVPLEVVYADEAIPTKRHEGLVCLATIRVAGAYCLMEECNPRRARRAAIRCRACSRLRSSRQTSQ